MGQIDLLNDGRGLDGQVGRGRCWWGRLVSRCDGGLDYCRQRMARTMDIPAALAEV